MNAEYYILDGLEFDGEMKEDISLIPIGSLKMETTNRSLLAESKEVAKPKAAFKISRVEHLTEKEARLDEVTFISELLVSNLAGLGRAFPFIVTEGPELANWAASLPPGRQMIASAIRFAVLKQAEDRLEKRILASFNLSKIAAMTPGALAQWPLAEQTPLFRLLSPLPEIIGVTLLPRLWMSPEMSSSGIFFQTDGDYHNCRLCAMESCPVRRYPIEQPPGLPQF